MSRASDIADLFKAVPEVQAIHIAQRFGVTNVHVLVSMPQFNRKVWDRLIETEIKSDRILGAEYHFIPVEVADPFYLTPEFLGGQVWTREAEVAKTDGMANR